MYDCSQIPTFYLARWLNFTFILSRVSCQPAGGGSSCHFVLLKGQGYAGSCARNIPVGGNRLANEQLRNNS
jgi:hypothetical protein